MDSIYRPIFGLARLGGLVFVADNRYAQGRAADDAAESYHHRAIQLTSAATRPKLRHGFEKLGRSILLTAFTYMTWQPTTSIIRITQMLWPIIGDYVKRVGPTALGWTLQGEYLFERKQFDAAYQSLREALDLSSTNYRAHELLGLIFSLHRHYDLGLEELKTAVAQNPLSAQTTSTAAASTTVWQIIRLLASNSHHASSSIPSIRKQPKISASRSKLWATCQALWNGTGRLLHSIRPGKHRAPNCLTCALPHSCRNSLVTMPMPRNC